jgi:hypothetical protein
VQAGRAGGQAKQKNIDFIDDDINPKAGFMLAVHEAEARGLEARGVTIREASRLPKGFFFIFYFNVDCIFLPIREASRLPKGFFGGSFCTLIMTSGNFSLS